MDIKFFNLMAWDMLAYAFDGHGLLTSFCCCLAVFMRFYCDIVLED